ncbi:MAG TPA: FAD/NAD(P)-binding oxidoreductase [Capsulimonadaceae bacterium]|nr:FAD/NAD(P)-binding oxidoreductase [Capsulimonadaceae bacterium]
MRYLIVGGGLTAANAAQSIREHDKEGAVLIVGKEKHPPYDRPPLSKNFQLDQDLNVEDILSKNETFYGDNTIQLHVGAMATGIDRAAKQVTLDDGCVVTYEKLLLATGATPRILDAPGAKLSGVCYLRTVDDAEGIRMAGRESKRAVMVGAGYIGMEVGADCLKRGLEVTIIDPANQPWSRFASATLGGFLQKYFEKQGAKFHFGHTVAEFVGRQGLESVKTDKGLSVPADFAVVGAGVQLNTDLAKEAGLEVDPKQGVKVDSYLQTSDPNVWAAGDIAYFEDVALGQRWHAEHYLNAQWQGQAVGAIMAGEKKPYDKIPYFFSDMGDLHMILRGNVSEHGETTVLGDLDAARFVELYPDPSGTLRMGVAFSEKESELEPISDKLEALIREKARVADIKASDFGM